MRTGRARATLAAIALLAASLALAGCGGDGDGGDPETEFERALAGLGDGISPTGFGFGWADLDALSDRAAGSDWVGDALGPGADDLIDDMRAISRATGLVPSPAGDATAVTASYSLGVRFDGGNPGRLPELLRAAGARTREAGDWTLYDTGGFAEGVTRGPLLPLGALMSRVAIGPAGVVLARFEPARTSLIDESGALELEGTAQAAGADCLGEVTAARLIKGFHTHDPADSPDLIAIGVRRDGDSWSEVLCAVDDAETNEADRAVALERSLSPGAIDVVTGAPLAEVLERVDVGGDTEGEWEIARAELELRPEAEPGFLFGALARGSVLTYLGAERPGAFEEPGR